MAVFFDDILVYSTTLADHVQHLTTVLETLREHSFFVKLSKCSFGQQSVEYLGHIVSVEGVHVDPHKISVVTDWPVPSNVKQLRGFLGLTGYYRRFVRHYAQVAFPLTELLKKNQFVWSPEAQQAFEALKVCLTSAPVLRLPDFAKQFVVETDASGYGIGAVLSQENHPLAFFSKKMSPKMSLASTYVRELYAITQAVAKWRHYLLGRLFVIQTDHKSLKELMHQVIQTPEQQFYLAKLLGFQFEVLYRAGKTNMVADALSRLPKDDGDPLVCYFFAITAAQHTIMTHLHDVNTSHAYCVQLHEAGRLGSLPDGFSIRNGLLLYRNKYFVPDDADLQHAILEYYHSSLVGGHGGLTKTLQGVNELFYWANMRASVQSFVKQCVVCQHTKYSTSKPMGLLQPLPIPSAPWEELSMDFIVGLPQSHGFTAILVVVDRFTKGAHFMALRPHFTARYVAEIFVTQVVKLHGFPKHIVTDRDPIFFSSFWRGLMQHSGTHLHYSTAYHPQSDGQTEVVNRCLEQYLRAFAADQPSKWQDFLAMAEFWYNTSYHSATQMSPYQALYGFNPPKLPDYSAGLSSVDSVDALLRIRQDIREQLRVNLELAQLRMKKYADGKRRDKQFVVGDQVLVKFHHYRQSSVARRLNYKLSKRYYGPFAILERIGNVAYKLDLPAESKVHPVFHVSLLKEFHGTIPIAASALPTDVISVFPTPVAIIDRRVIEVAGQQEQQVLVEWQGQSRDEATWESWQTLQ